jgi:hypothetical protein
MIPIQRARAPMDRQLKSNVSALPVRDRINLNEPDLQPMRYGRIMAIELKRLVAASVGRIWDMMKEIYYDNFAKHQNMGIRHGCNAASHSLQHRCAADQP